MAQILNSKSQTSGNLAIEKLKAEAKEFYETPSLLEGMIGSLMYCSNKDKTSAENMYKSNNTVKEVLNLVAVNLCENIISELINFCNQSEVFAEAVCNDDRHLKACMETVLKDIGCSISDIEAYRRAVAYYFETADISFEMTLHLNSEEKAQKSALVLNLFDML